MEPTNQDIRDDFAKHSREDQVFQTNQTEFNVEMALFKAETEGSLASLHAKFDGLATKEDIGAVLQFMKQINIGTGLFRFTWNNAAKIGGILLLVFGIYLFFKGGLIAVLAYFLDKGKL